MDARTVSDVDVEATVTIRELKATLVEWERAWDHHNPDGLIVVHLLREGIRLGQIVHRMEMGDDGHLTLYIADCPQNQVAD